ncbi:zinc-ribbon domain-containing protein [Limosilactobacillus coleohominis]
MNRRVANCPTCGNKVVPGNKFCTKCGVKLN